jgi:hypothetical protein
MKFAYNKETGEKTGFQFNVDYKEALASGNFTADEPKGKKEAELSSEEYEERVSITERARLGGPIEEGERGKLIDVPSPDLRNDVVGIEERYPNARAPVGPEAESVNAQAAQKAASSGPDRTEVADTFNPATADRDQLFKFLRDNGEDPENASSTSTLRARATAKLSPKKEG